MADPRSRLQVVDEIPDFPQNLIPSAPEKPDPGVLIGAKALMIGLGALSQRMVVALSSLWLGFFTISTVFSVWVLWYLVPEPGNSQLVALGIYCVFILAMNIIIRRV